MQQSIWVGDSTRGRGTSVPPLPVPLIDPFLRIFHRGRSSFFTGSRLAIPNKPSDSLEETFFSTIAFRILTSVVPLIDSAEVRDFDYDEIGSGYYDRILDDGVEARRRWHLLKFRAINKHLKTTADSTILDVGCAAGTFLARLHVPHARAVGVDIAAPQIEYAARRHGSDQREFICADIRSFDLGERFDFAVCSEVIEHLTVEDTQDILRGIARHLKPDGQLIITTPNYRSHWPLLEFVLNRVSVVSYEHQHITRLDASMLRRRLTEAGFIPTFEGTFHVIAPFTTLPYAWARRVADLESRYLPKAGALLLAVARFNNRE